MIIIKSQDGRKIVKCNDVRQNEDYKCEIISNVKCVHYDTETFEFIYDYDLLGTYDSEQLANKVMVDIENHIRELYTTKNSVMMINYGTDIMALPGEEFMEEAIFTMPKE